MRGIRSSGGSVQGQQRFLRPASWAIGLIVAGGLTMLVLPRVPVRAASGKVPLGGAHGTVKRADGFLLEGVAVQLIAGKTGIRTTVYSNQDGQYEFPVLERDMYTLRIARPVEFKPWFKEGVQISGSPKLDDIVLARVSNTEFLPPTPEVVAQLSGVEWLMNLPGTAEEKKLLSNQCTHCHSYQQIFRNRYDEASWRIIVRRMMRGGGSPLINVNNNPSPAAV